MSFKSGYAAVIGVPNAGKSSLVNSLIRESVSIVTAKPQTTRKRTMGILTLAEQYQIIFVDTPGVIESDAGLNGYLRNELQEGLKGVDVVIAAVAPWEFESERIPWVLQTTRQLKNAASVIYVATQCDKKSEITEQGRLARWKQWHEALNPVIPTLLSTSSRTRLGLDDLKNLIVGNLKEGPQYYDVELFTPQSMREMAAEAVRKQCFELLHQEIPYGLAVLPRRFEEGDVYKIEADIVVSKDSHKGMVIGKGGLALKEIGTRARADLEKMFDHRVFLKLHVVVKPSWMKNRSIMEELGYGNTEH